MVCHYGFITSLYSTIGHSYSLYTNHYTSVYITTPKGHLSHQLMPTRCNYNCFGRHQIVLGCKQLIVRWNRMLRYTSKLPYFLSESSGLPQSKISHFTIPYLLPLLNAHRPPLRPLLERRRRMKSPGGISRKRGCSYEMTIV